MLGRTRGALDIDGLAMKLRCLRVFCPAHRTRSLADSWNVEYPDSRSQARGVGSPRSSEGVTPPRRDCPEDKLGLDAACDPQGFRVLVAHCAAIQVPRTLQLYPRLVTPGPSRSGRCITRTSTCGVPPKLPAAARSRAVRALRFGSGLAREPDCALALACAEGVALQEIVHRRLPARPGLSAMDELTKTAAMRQRQHAGCRKDARLCLLTNSRRAVGARAAPRHDRSPRGSAEYLRKTVPTDRSAAASCLARSKRMLSRSPFNRDCSLSSRSPRRWLTISGTITAPEASSAFPVPAHRSPWRYCVVNTWRSDGPATRKADAAPSTRPRRSGKRRREIVGSRTPALAVAPVAVGDSSAAGSPPGPLGNAKSRSLTLAIAVTRMLLGFRSRWITRFFLVRELNSGAHLASGEAARRSVAYKSQYTSIGWPSISSSRYGRPSDVSAAALY